MFPSYVLRVRVHYLITIFLSIATVAIVWWNAVKQKDFMTPPNAEEIALARQETLDSLAVPGGIAPEQPIKAILVKPTKLSLPNPELDTVVVAEKETQTEMGDLTTSPGLDQYADLSEKGADHMEALATLFETKGELQRALLAWERMVDVVSADSDQRTIAYKAIARLTPQLPPWNIDPTAAQTIVFHSGCDRDVAALIEPLMQEITALISANTSGILQVQANVNAGPRPSKDGPKLPIALWFSGKDEKSQQSKTITISSESTDPEVLRKALLTSAYKLIRDEIGSQTAFQAPMELKPDHDVGTLFGTAVTRLSWMEFGTRLNKIPTP